MDSPAVGARTVDCRLSPRTVERYASLLEDRGQAVAVANDTVFYNYNRVVEPMAPAGHDPSLTEQQERELQQQLGGVLVRFGRGFSDRDTGWYFVICDDYPAVADNPSADARRNIRKGLRECRVEQVDADYMARHGYETYASAHARYSGSQSIESEREFVRKVRTAAPYDDLVHYWAVFYGGKLVGYGANYVYEDVEVASTELKLDPAYLKKNSSAALMHAMTEHYLSSGTAWLNAGGRSLAHDTAFQDYLTGKFGYHRAHVLPRVAFRPAYALGLGVARPLRRVLARVDSRFDALYELYRLSRSEHSVPRAGSPTGE